MMIIIIALGIFFIFQTILVNQYLNQVLNQYADAFFGVGAIIIFISIISIVGAGIRFMEQR